MGKLAHVKSVTALPHEFVYSRDRELSRACTPAIAPDTIKFAAGQFDGLLSAVCRSASRIFKDEGLDIELPPLIPALAQNALLAGEIHYHELATRDNVLGLVRYARNPRLD